MALFCSLHCHRHRLQLPLLLAVLFAASRGDDDYNPSICKLQQPYRCGVVDISYPFYLSGETADILGNKSSSCGYPGFAIDCVGDAYPTLQLGSSPDDSYNVTAINYTSFTVSLTELDVVDGGGASCPINHNVTVPPNLWLKLLPQYTVAHLLFFANCSSGAILGQPYINPITCPRSSVGSYSFVIYSDWEVPKQTLSMECDQVIRVPVLQNASVTMDQQWSSSGYRTYLNQGFQLGWNKSLRSDGCANCEGSKGGCAYSKDGEFVACLCSDGRVTEQECPKDAEDT